MSTLDFTMIHVISANQAGLLAPVHCSADPSWLPSGLSDALRYSGGTAGDLHPVPYSSLPGTPEMCIAPFRKIRRGISPSVQIINSFCMNKKKPRSRSHGVDHLCSLFCAQRYAPDAQPFLSSCLERALQQQL